MPMWYFDKKQLKLTPSYGEGIKTEAEKKYRSDGAKFILNLGLKMGLRHLSISTGALYFHRFYMCHSFKKFPRYHLTGCACLFLAGKVEETPKKAKDLMRWAKTTLQELKGSDDVFNAFGEDPKEEMLVMECVILQTIKFDLQVEHPYYYLVKYAKIFRAPLNQVNDVVQMAWGFVNDSWSGTTLCLQWEPEVLAIGLLSLASKMNELEPKDWAGKKPNHTKWWQLFVEGVSQKHIDDIGHQILDMYDTTNTKLGGGSGSGMAKAPGGIGSSGAGNAQKGKSPSPPSPKNAVSPTTPKSDLPSSSQPPKLSAEVTSITGNGSGPTPLMPKKDITQPTPPPPPPPSFPPPPPELGPASKKPKMESPFPPQTNQPPPSIRSSIPPLLSTYSPISQPPPSNQPTAPFYNHSRARQNVPGNFSGYQQPPPPFQSQAPPGGQFGGGNYSGNSHGSGRQQHRPRHHQDRGRNHRYRRGRGGR